MKLTNKLSIITILLFSIIIFTSCGDDKSKKAGPAAQEEVKEVVKEETKKANNFSKIDTDQDKKITKDEFASYGKTSFTEKDKNANGKIEKDECPNFEEFNTDEDDFLSEEEFVKGRETMFAKMDTNADGSIDKEEMDMFMTAIIQEG